MGIEINLLEHYPRTKRKVLERGASKTAKDIEIARRFGREFFDGDRRTGYGGFSYHPRFWENVIPTFRDHFKLTDESRVLDVGCAKGFMMFDFQRIIPGITVKGIDISPYAIENGLNKVRSHMSVANANALPFEDDSFDAVISINTIHNLPKEECGKALQEIERVSRGKSFIMVDAFRTPEEEELMFHWNLTAQTILHVDEWIEFFKAVGYTGDFFWFTP